jgi:hypothetical protein
MSPDIDRERSHLRAWELLPWVVSDGPSGCERAEVEAHLAGCGRCRLELALETRLAVAMNATRVAGPDVDQGLERLIQRIDLAGRQRIEPPREKPGMPNAAGRRWMAVACALGAVMLVRVGYLGVLDKPDAHGLAASSYRTLSSQPVDATAQVTIRLVIDPSMPARELQRLLVSSHLQILGGPSDSGVYSLGPTSASADVVKQLDTLRAASGVRFAEPVQHPGAP